VIASATATLFVSPVFHDGAERTGRSLENRRRRTDPVFLGYVAAASVTNIAALFVILSSTAGTQYLLATLDYDPRRHADHRHRHQEDIDVHDALTEWQVAMATAVLAMLPPVAVVVLMQRLFVKGLIETEK